VRRLIYSMTASLDGYIAGPAGEIDWSAPDAELHRFHNELVRAVGVQLCGRGLYETMLYWETAHEQPDATAETLEFAEIWRQTPKVVVSRTLEEVVPGYRLLREDAVEEVAAMKREAGADLAVGGAGLAATMIEHGLVDELRVFLAPVVLGAGTPYFPPGCPRLDLRLLETRVFGSRVVYLRYEAGRGTR
jgi:dihydrofolate reductase